MLCSSMENGNVGGAFLFLLLDVSLSLPWGPVSKVDSFENDGLHASLVDCHLWNIEKAKKSSNLRFSIQPLWCGEAHVTYASSTNEGRVWEMSVLEDRYGSYDPNVWVGKSNKAQVLHSSCTMKC